MAVPQRTPALAPFLLIVFAITIGCTGAPPPGVRIVEVIDGDTIVIATDGVTERLRLIGVDTPESVDPNRPVQCFGPEATRRVEELLPPGTRLLVERDHEARDRYGRLLGYVHRFDDGLFINATLLREGFGDLLLIEPNTTRRAELEAASTAARTEHAGLWGVCGGPDVAIDPPLPTAG